MHNAQYPLRVRASRASNPADKIDRRHVCRRPTRVFAAVARGGGAAHPGRPALLRNFALSTGLNGHPGDRFHRKLDIVAAAVPPVALLWRGYRLSQNKGPEISVRFATELVLAYFLFFPLDLFFISRGLAENAPNPSLYAALLATVHLLLFATLVRLYSARTNRDYAFLSVLSVTCMLASAILTVETSFLVALAVFLVLAVSTFVALEMRRSATGAVSPALDPGSPLAKQLNRALGFTSLGVASGAFVLGAMIFFLIPRWTSGYLSALSLQPSLMTGFGDSVTLGQIGVIKQSKAVVMRISFEGDGASQGIDLHWRGMVFTNFDGKRWYTPQQKSIVVSASGGGGV